MKFNLNVKPLKDAMDLGVINSNISKFFEKSTVIELTVNGNELHLNTQATSLLSEAVILGNNEESGTGSAIVDCTLFKSLISSMDSNEVTLDFQETALVVTSGRSKFNVPKLLTDEDGASLDKPVSEEELANKFCGELNPGTWKYIQDHQLYAVAASQIHKVYTRVWVSKDKGVLTGDPNNSVFTYQPESDLDSDCLVSSTIVNLLSALDEGTKLYHVDSTTYVAKMDVDSFSFCAQFTVEHENENNMGEYDSDMIFDMVLDESQQEVSISKSKMASNVKQASLFASASNPYISIDAKENGVYLVNDNVNCRISKDNPGLTYDVQFMLSDIDTVVSHMDDNDMTVSPIVKGEEVFGVRFKSGDMVALLGGVD